MPGEGLIKGKRRKYVIRKEEGKISHEKEKKSSPLLSSWYR